jgi:hypothetical protein
LASPVAAFIRVFKCMEEGLLQIPIFPELNLRRYAHSCHSCTLNRVTVLLLILFCGVDSRNRPWSSGQTTWNSVLGSRAFKTPERTKQSPIGPMNFPETSVNNYGHTLRNTPEERRHLHRGGSLQVSQPLPWLAVPMTALFSSQECLTSAQIRADTRCVAQGYGSCHFCANGTDFLPTCCCILHEKQTSPRWSVARYRGL